MLHIQFEIEGYALNNCQMAYEEGFMEGDVFIYIDGHLYLNGEAFTIVELAMQLGKWLDAVKHDELRPFVYTSIDYEEPLLYFDVEQDGLRIRSPWEEFVCEKHLPIEEVTAAVTKFIVALNEQLHEFDYVLKLDRFLDRNISKNAKALMLYEQNDYDRAFTLLKQIAKDEPSVQSFNNLAYMYLREEEQSEQAKELLLQVIEQKPASHFPYNMLAEIAMDEQQFEQAEQYLLTSIQMQPTEAAHHNLGIVYFYQQRYEEAIQQFSQFRSFETLSGLYEIYAYVISGKKAQAMDRLRAWTKEYEAYVSEVEVADLYVELEQYEAAWEIFQRRLTTEVHASYLVKRVAYVLRKLQQKEQYEHWVQKQIQYKKQLIQEIEEEAVEENWTLEDKRDILQDESAELQQIEALQAYEAASDKPPFEYVLYPYTGCYLFGCLQHGHQEYGMSKK